MTTATRRAVLLLPVAASAAMAQEGDMAAAERAILAGRTPREAGIAFDMPRLSENGNSVDVAVRVDSPMTAADHVRAIHILSEKNPVPRVASFFLTPRAGRAEVATRIRLATSQQIIVLAETSAGEVHRAAREVIVVLGACVEGG
ncbi:thiosulfate oxidation carrier protein SoxY [Roseomonas rosulenta]|uniref:thiosulfate oxidation carrier protein SoxY n=1 Tax=Roseomonas rosulenta TaxID=2748667 RepID=UPI0018DF5A98|nr:thiosulfate oxidation carrier protein SoxY [Roseomonas rosulenta]